MPSCRTQSQGDNPIKRQGTCFGRVLDILPMFQILYPSRAVRWWQKEMLVHNTHSCACARKAAWSGLECGIHCTADSNSCRGFLAAVFTSSYRPKGLEERSFVNSFVARRGQAGCFCILFQPRKMK
jgi:hypothetical protein